MAEHDQQTKLLGGRRPSSAALAGQRQVHVIILRIPCRTVRGSRVVVDFPTSLEAPISPIEIRSD